MHMACTIYMEGISQKAGAVLLCTSQKGWLEYYNTGEHAAAAEESPSTPAMTSYAASRAITTEVSFGHAPQKPKTLDMKLQDRRSPWQKFSENAHDCTPERLMEAISSEQYRIMACVKSKGYITQEEADVLNNTTEEKMEKILTDFKKKAVAQFEVAPQDTPEEIELKMGMIEQLMKWLSDTRNLPVDHRENPLCSPVFHYQEYMSGTLISYSSYILCTPANIF